MHIKNLQLKSRYFGRKKIMAQMDSKELIESFKEKLLQINQDFEQLIKEHETNLLLHKPSTKQWSAIECIQHVYLTNKYYLPKLKKVLAKAGKVNNTPKKTFKPGFIGNYMYNTMKPINGKVKNKVGTFNSIDPNKKYANASLDAEKVIENFRRQQHELKELIGLTKEVGLEYGRIPSLLGAIISFKPGDVLRFLLAHEERHLIQAKAAIPQTIA